MGPRLEDEKQENDDGSTSQWYWNDGDDSPCGVRVEEADGSVFDTETKEGC